MKKPIANIILNDAILNFSLKLGTAEISTVTTSSKLCTGGYNNN